MNYSREQVPPLFAQGIRPGSFIAAKLAEVLEVKGHPSHPPVDPSVRAEDRPRLTGQNAQVLAWLQAGEKVTPRFAFADGVQRLAARVHDLRQAGYAVKSAFDGSTAVYWMEVKS